MNPKLQHAILALIAIAALSAGVLLGQSQRGATPASTPASTPLADPVTQLTTLTLPDLNGKPQDFAQWKGKRWVVNFWATWCTPCREEMPMLAALATQNPDTVQVIGIGIDTPEAMRDFVKQTPVPYPLLVGGNDVIALTARLGNKAMALPYTVVLDASGTVRGQHLGKVTAAQLNILLGL